MIHRSELIIFFSIILSSLLAQPQNNNFSITTISPTEKKIAITLDIEPPHALIKESLFFTSTNPAVILSPWESDKAAILLQEHQGSGFTGKTTFSFVAHLEPHVQDKTTSTIMMHYRLDNSVKPEELLFTVEINPKSDPEVNSQAGPICKVPNLSKIEQANPSSTSMTVSRMMASLQSLFHTAKKQLSNLVQKTESLPGRLMVVLLLGLLMSLTPCIYPMIPITIGILQITPGQSIGRNFTLALSYTLGIGLTFALLGLFAACGGAQFGQLMGNPIFVIIIVA
ncbi:MAG TPA: cytochrome c biogenesis protein CcdA, partial [Candidatus Babeliaceae bacterium]|nr:cytochrome c biogenesis protein CcdA [Candidatus Babeliaceae bacterium]